jgi:hypothetical protein
MKKYFCFLIIVFVFFICGCKDENNIGCNDPQCRFVVIGHTKIQKPYSKSSLDAVIYVDTKTNRQYLYFWNGGRYGGTVFTSIEENNEKAEKELRYH